MATTLKIYLIPKRLRILAGIYLGLLFHFVIGSTETDHKTPPLEKGIPYDSLYISSVSFKIKDSIGDPARWIRTARSVITLREGEIISLKKIEESKSALEYCNYFQNVSIEYTLNNNTADIIITLLPYYIIHSIKIRGEFPVFESEIRKILTIHSGKIFIPDNVHSQEEIIKNFLFKQGFKNSTVSTGVYFNKQKGYCNIAVKIHNSQQIRIGEITLKGNNRFSNYRIKRLMVTWRNKYIPGASKGLVENQIKADIKRIEAFYRQKNFPDSKVQYQVKNDSLDENTVLLEITIQEGLQYDFTFTGIRVLKKRQLKNAIHIIQQGNRNDIGLKKCMRNIKKLYAQNGFYEPVITQTDTIAEFNNIEKRYICYHIEAGSRAITNKIIIKGNNAFSQEHLLSFIKSRPKGFLKKGLLFKERLNNDINALLSMYRDHGYISASVSHELQWSENKKQVAIIITIHEGLQVLIDSISIIGQNSDYTSELLSKLTISIHSPFRKNKIQENEIIISRYIGEKGYPNVKVSSKVIFNEEKSDVKIQYMIEEGKFVLTGNLFFRGNFKTKEHILKEKMDLPPGEPFSLIQMVEGQQNIRNMNIFNSVKYRTFGLREQRDTVSLFIDIDEKKSYSIDFGTGYSSNENVYAKFKAKNLNLAGLNKSLVINGNVGIKEQWTGVSFIEPDLWEKPISAFIDLSAKRVIDSTFSYWSMGPSIGLQRKIGKKIFMNISSTYELRKLFNAENTQTDTLPRNILQFSPSISFDTRDSYTRPQKGLYSALNLNLSKGLGKSNDDFIKSKFDFRFYLTPFKNLTIAARSQLWHITTYGRIDTLPVDQLFSIGGPLTVRGFRDNIKFSYKTKDNFFGYAAYIGNIEFRIDIGFNFELAFFVDGGGLGNNFFQNRWFGNRFTLGGGLRYTTPIGPVGVLYGFKIDRNADEKEIGALKFSIGYMF